MRFGPARAVGRQPPGAATDPAAEVQDPAPDPGRIFLYRGERRPGGVYRELWTGPGLERLLGGPVPPGVDLGQLILARIPPEDRERVERLFSYEAMLAVDSVETDYRVLGLDGQVRIVRDRGEVHERDAERVIFSGSMVDVTEEHRRTEQLGRVERRLDQAAAGASLVLWEVEFDDDGRYTAVDTGPGLDGLLGGTLPPSEDPAAQYAERVHPDDQAAYRVHVEALKAGVPTSIEYRFLGVDGRTRWIWTRAGTSKASGPRRVVGVSADVTDRRRQDGELLADGRQVASLLDTVRVMLVTLEYGSDGALVDARVLGNVEHFMGLDLPSGPDALAVWLDHVDPDDRQRVQDRLAGLAGDAAVMDLTYRVRREDGREVVVHSHARRRTTAGAEPTIDVILSDVTEAELTAAALEETEQRLAHVLHATDDAVYSVEIGADGRFGALQANDRWFALFGRPGADTTAEALFMAAVHPADRAAAEEGNDQLRAGGSIEQEYRVIDRNGRERWLLDRAWVRRRADGSQVADGIQVDITERRTVEQELRRARAASTRVATEQALLRELATAIAEGKPAKDLFGLAARQASRLVDGDGGTVVRFDPDGGEVVGVHHPQGPTAEAAARSTRIAPSSAAEEVRLGGVAARRDGASPTHGGPSRSNLQAADVAAPVRVAGRLWGAVSGSYAAGRPVPEDAETRLADVADLVALAVSEAETRRLLAERALSDPLTGLANHRAFHEELETEVVRARRYDRRLSLVLLDVDHFKAINDTGGHPVGDATLQRVADLLQSLVRSGELVGRVGGDELAVLLPETDAAGGAALAERARQALTSDPLHGGGLTLSAGVSELSGAEDADELYEQADRALLWTKRNGRDGVSRYDPQTMQDGVPLDHDGRLARSHARSGLHALVRAIDLREPRLAGHAERVAVLADRLAARLGWSTARRALLREAAFLHDVGKIGTPASVLRAGSGLDTDERSTTRAHALFGAQMAAEVLDPDQTSWIRHHHERWDGTGYPHGLQGDAIPDGASVLGLAEAWDAMTRTPLNRAEALSECGRESGRQFSPDAVEALRALEASGDLPGPAAA